jgi:uncharacterized membrane protein
MSSESTKNSASPKQFTAILASAVFTGAVLSLLLLGSKSLWLDEMLNIRLAEGGLTALFGVLAILMAYLLARELFGTRTGRTAAWLVATAPALVWYSQEARSYSLLIFLTLLSTYAFIKLFRRLHFGWWLLYVLATTAALFTHYVAFLLLVIQLMLALVMSLYERPTFRQGAAFALAWVATGLAYLPWARTPAAARFADLFESSRIFTVGSFELLLHRPVYQIILIGEVLILAALVIAFVVLRPRAERASQRLDELRQNKIIQGLLILSFLALLVVSVVPRGYSVKRQLLILVPFILILYAWFWPWTREKRRVLVSTILPSILASLINIIAVPKNQWRETVAYLGDNDQANDVVLLVPS